jgi:pimeloyl-ACP methyl ester carboxylesterase
MGSSKMWREVVTALAPDFDVIAPDALGHNGGPPATKRPASIGDVIDMAEQQLDELGIERAHLAGNSMGGWTALELARRGRALSVCALSPAGLWPNNGESMAKRTRHLRRGLQMGRATHPLLPLAYRLRTVRAFALRDVAAHPGSVSAAEALALTEDMLATTIADDLLSSDDEYFTTLDPLPCPVAVYWSEHDRIFPEPQYRIYAGERLPAASYDVLADVGHVPMLDSAQLVIDCIRATASLALNA